MPCSVGALLGHEMTHAFDDQGRRYGPYGKMHNWWDNRTAAAYALRAKCLAQYYSNMTVEGNPRPPHSRLVIMAY